MSHTLVRFGAAAAALCCAGAVSAAVITYDVRGTIVGSPLDGQIFEGYFSAAEGPGGLFGVALPLVDLAFQFDGRWYTEDDVAGRALFNLGGVRTLFGTACADDSIYPGSIACSLSTTGDNWFMAADNGAAGLSFAVRGVSYFADATLTVREPSPVPEPASWALVLGALGCAVLARRRSPGVRQDPWRVMGHRARAPL